MLEKTKVDKLSTITLGMLTAFGPFLTDFYLPFLPELSRYFNTSPAVATVSLTAGMIGLAVGQIFIGPLSDRYGRRKLLIISMAGFIVSTVLCLLAPDIAVFNFCRLLQGLTGAGGVVLAKSVATDLFTGKPLADFLALLGAINGVAPVAAPVVGGVLSKFTTWRGVFVVLLFLGIILLLLCMRLKETLAPDKRSKGGLLPAYANLFKVFKNPRFSLSTIANMCSFFTFFAYVAASPFIFQSVYHLSAFQYSICLGLNALFIIVGTMLTTKFHHNNTALKWAAIDLLASALLVGLAQIFHAPLAVMMPCYIYMLISFGMMQPVSTAIAMDSERNNAGAASAMFGASSFVAGAMVSPVVTIGNVLVSASIVMVGGALLCTVFTLPLCNKVKHEQMQANSKEEHR